MIIEKSDEFIVICPFCGDQYNEYFVNDIKLPHTFIRKCSKCHKRYVVDLSFEVKTKSSKIIEENKDNSEEHY